MVLLQPIHSITYLLLNKEEPTSNGLQLSAVVLTIYICSQLSWQSATTLNILQLSCLSESALTLKKYLDSLQLSKYAMVCALDYNGLPVHCASACKTKTKQNMHVKRQVEMQLTLILSVHSCFSRSVKC